MTTAGAKRLALGAAILLSLGSATPLSAQIEIGTWVRTVGPGTPGGMTMTVEACCKGGRRLIYIIGESKQRMTLDSPFDGTEVPVLLDGKPSGETMAIKRLDAHHAYTVLKMNGQPFATSTATLSADGNTLTVANEYVTAGAGGTPGTKVTEVWVRK
jgi:hypothetical protein